MSTGPSLLGSHGRHTHQFIPSLSSHLEALALHLANAHLQGSQKESWRKGPGLLPGAA